MRLTLKVVFSSLLLLAMSCSSCVSRFNMNKPEAASDVIVSKYLATEKFSIPVQLSGADADAFWGQAHDPKVTLVEFADMECPACIEAAQRLEEVRKIFSKDLLIVFKHFPLDQGCNQHIKRQLHPTACMASVYSRCVGADNFWKFYDFVFKVGSPLPEVSNYDALLTQEFKMTPEQVQACHAAVKNKDSAIMKKIKQDMDLAKSINLKSTPSIFIQGQLFTGNRARDLIPTLETLMGK